MNGFWLDLLASPWSATSDEGEAWEMGTPNNKWEASVTKTELMWEIAHRKTSLTDLTVNMTTCSWTGTFSYHKYVGCSRPNRRPTYAGHFGHPGQSGYFAHTVLQKTRHWVRTEGINTPIFLLKATIGSPTTEAVSYWSTNVAPLSNMF